MRRLFILLALTFITVNSNAQVGYLGKRYTLTVGTSIAPPILNLWFQMNNPQRLNSIVIFSDWALLPPEVRLNAGVVLSERVQFSLEGSWRGLQNTGFYSYLDNVDFTNGSDSYIDSFMMKTNVLNLKGSFKFYYEYAPIGKYFAIGGGITRSVSDVYPTYSIQHYDYDTEIETVTSDKREPGVYTANHFSVNAGFGRTRMLSKSLILDYGFRCSYFFGTYQFGPSYSIYDPEESNYQDYFPDIITYIQKINLQSSYAFEIYFNFGLCR